MIILEEEVSSITDQMGDLRGQIAKKDEYIETLLKLLNKKKQEGLTTHREQIKQCKTQIFIYIYSTFIFVNTFFRSWVFVVDQVDESSLTLKNHIKNF